MRSKTTKGTKAARTPSSAAPGGGLCLATVTRWDEGGVFVQLPQDDRESAARVMLPPGTSASGTRVAVGRSVVVMLDAGGPVVMGVLQPIGETALAKAEACVDGRRVELVAEDEIVLKCGEASLVLRRNGRVVLRGVQVETRAKGLNRIKGGTVAIN